VDSRASSPGSRQFHWLNSLYCAPRRMTLSRTRKCSPTNYSNRLLHWR
jgi:hypothetical protein